MAAPSWDTTLNMEIWVGITNYGRVPIDYGSDDMFPITMALPSSENLTDHNFVQAADLTWMESLKVWVSGCISSYYGTLIMRKP